jgi:phage terminase large subunit GpA-like protein
MQTWPAQVRKWLECWDVEKNRAKDIELLQQFYNNVLGLPFKERGEQLKLERVETHRRTLYHSGQIPNLVAKKETGGKIQLLTCTVDVHKEHLDIKVTGWCPRGCFYSIEWMKLEGEIGDIDSEPWQILRELIENKVYKADDGRQYRIQLTLIDSQYNAELVHRFCGQYSQAVHPIRGTELPLKGKTLKEFSEFESSFGTRGFNITTTIYKDRLNMSLRQDWDGMDLQPNWHPNFPEDYPRQFFKELTIETKREEIDSKTGKSLGFRWFGRGAHSWDLMVYSMAAHDMIAFNVCQAYLQLEQLNLPAFWKLCEDEALFWEKP